MPCPLAGCGNSALSHDLHELGYTDVTSIDFSPACIAAMRARYARCPGLRWAVMDIRALAFPDAAFDVVLEKGTLDVLMVDETDPWDVSPQAAAAMHRVLAEVLGVGGRWGGVGGGPHPHSGSDCPLATLLPWGCPSRCLCPPLPRASATLSATLQRGIWGAPGTPGGVGDTPPPLPPHHLLPREVDAAGGVSLGTLCPAGGLGDSPLYLHPKYKKVAVKIGPILAWVAVEAPEGAQRWTWGGTQPRWPCPPRAR